MIITEIIKIVMLGMAAGLFYCAGELKAEGDSRAAAIGSVLGAILMVLVQLAS